jgi:hypothetical protein
MLGLHERERVPYRLLNRRHRHRTNSTRKGGVDNRRTGIGLREQTRLLPFRTLTTYHDPTGMVRTGHGAGYHGDKHLRQVRLQLIGVHNQGWTAFCGLEVRVGKHHQHHRRAYTGVWLARVRVVKSFIVSRISALKPAFLAISSPAVLSLNEFNRR